MKKTALSIGATLMLGLLALTVVQPALADHRDHDRRHCRHDNHQPFSQSYYNDQYSRYQNRKYGRHNVRYGHHKRWNKHADGQRYRSYGSYQYGYSGHQDQGHHRHFHRHGIIQLRHSTAGYAYCDDHRGYYRSGDLYY